MNIFSYVLAVASLATACFVGNWFLKENKKAKIAGLPWYAVYRTPPGIIVAVSILVGPLLIVLL